MKNSKRNFLTLLLLLASALCLIFAACGGGVKLSFETNCDVSVEAVTAEAGEEVELPKPAEREGYTFDGWYETSDFSGDPVEKAVAEADKTYYAKWTQLFTVTLDVGAGQLSTTKFYLKAGENIANSVKDLVPTRDGFQFGEWLMGNAALSSTAVMPSENVTLTAHYKVGYTVHVFQQNLAQTDYEAGKDITGYAYPAKNYTPTVEVEGFKVGTHDGELKTKDLTETPSENVYTFYLDRQQYTVTLLSNYPEGGEAREEIKFLYEEKVTLPYDLFSAEGYLLSGWSRTTTGNTPEYPSSAIKGLILNGDGKEYKDEFAFTSDITLYAIWQQGYRDLFGGGDIVFHPTEDADYVILQRLGNYYLGNYYAQNNTFDFENSKELSGRLFDNGFIYYDESRDGRTYYRYLAGRGILVSETVSLDAYNGIAYSLETETSASVSNGTYAVDEDGYFIAEYTSGPLSGTTVKMLMGNVQVSSTQYVRVFMTCNEDDAARGTMVQFGVIPSGESAGYIGNTSLTITLDGFGNALLQAGTASQSFVYQSDGDLFALYSSSGSLYGLFKFMNYQGTEGFILYDADLDHTFTSEDGATLELDGACNAVYTSDTDSMTGTFTASDSVFGGSIITFFANDGNQYFFRVYSEGAQADPIQSYLMEKKNVGYAEYLYSSDTSSQPLYSPLLVIDDADNCKASIYSRTTGTTRVYLKVAEGTYTYNEATDTYAFTVTKNITPEQDVFVNPIDVLHLKSFVYSIGSTSSAYVTYWYSVTYQGEDGGQDTTTKFDKKYTDEEGNTLTLVSGFAIYAGKNGEGETQSLVGVYSAISGYENVIRVTIGSASLFFELQESDTENTFLMLDSFFGLGTVREVGADGYISNSCALTFDGKGNATLTTVPEAEEGQEEEPAVVVKGTYKDAEKETAFGGAVYHFTPEDGTNGFDFIVLSNSNGAYFARFNDSIPREMSSTTGETLKLDGYSFMAEYTSPDMEGSVQGYYTIAEENVIEFVIGSYSFYFDIDPETQTFTLRGSEAATYFYFDNQYIDGLAFEFDGYGKATILQFDLENGGEPTELGVGEYSHDDNVWTVEYTKGADHHIYTGHLAFYPISSTQALNIFIKEYEDIVRSYIDEDDWSVLTPDSLGNATLYTATGLTERGTYVIITDDLMYYSGSDACIYRYDSEKGTIKKIAYNMDRGYYSSDLRALQFSRHGFMIMDGETSFFYTLDGQGNITTYEQDPNAEGANDYGFVTNTGFGKFEDTIVVGGVTYYNNNGIPIRFTRDEATKDEYPVAYNRNEDGTVNRKPLGGLIFQPTGTMEFAVTGSVEFEGEQQSCTFVRSAVYDEEGETVTGYEFYILIATYRFDIEMTYAGENESTYKITAMRSIISAYNNSFYSIYPLIAMFYGESMAASLRPAFGHFTVTEEYNEAGEVSDNYIDVDLGIYSVVTLLDGETVTALEHVDYESSVSGNARMFIVEYKGSDEQTYKFYFALTVDRNYGYVYFLHACTRVQTLTTDNYEVEVERTVVAENYSQNIFSVSLKEKDTGTECEYDELYLSGYTAYCVDRTRNHLSSDPDGVDTGRIRSSVYYILTFADKEDEDAGSGTEGSEGQEGEEEGAEPIPLFESVTIEKHETDVIYDEPGFNYVEIENGEVIAFFYQNGLYIVSSSEYDEATTTYTATLAGGAQVTIKITTKEDGSQTAEITPVQSSEA